MMRKKSACSCQAVDLTIVLNRILIVELLWHLNDGQALILEVAQGAVKRSR